MDLKLPVYMYEYVTITFSFHKQQRVPWKWHIAKIFGWNCKKSVYFQQCSFEIFKIVSFFFYFYLFLFFYKNSNVIILERHCDVKSYK